MAKIIHYDNTLENGIEELQSKSRKWLIVTLISFILFLPTFGITFIPFIIGGIMYNKYAAPLKLRNIGLEGEKRTSKIFNNLSDSYTVILNLNFNINGNSAIIDNLVVGPNGIFVIKAKSINGKIVGTSTDKYLTQHKVGRKGGAYSKEFYSPLKQVNSQIYKLSSLLKSKNLNERIQGVVYFSNPDCTVHINSIETPVFSQSARGVNEMTNFITNYKGNNIPFEKQEAIIRVLTSYNNNISQDTTKSQLNPSYEPAEEVHTENISQ